MKQIKAVAKAILGVAVAGAFLLAAPSRAQAQVSFGVAVGNYPPPPYAYDNGYAYNNGYAYYGNNQAYVQQRWAEHEQRERWEAEQRAEHWRHEQWEHSRDGWRDGDRYRDHDDHRDR